MPIVHYQPPANTCPLDFTYAGQQQTLMPPDQYWERVTIRKIVGHKVGEDRKPITDKAMPESARYEFATLRVWAPAESKVLRQTRPEDAGLSRKALTNEALRTVRQRPEWNLTLVKGERDKRSKDPDVFHVREVRGLERYLIDEDALMSGHMRSIHEVEEELNKQRQAVAAQLEDESSRLEAYRREEVERIRQEARNQAETEREAIEKDEAEKLRKTIADKIRRQAARQANRDQA